jgi:hypothetical protein
MNTILNIYKKIYPGIRSDSEFTYNWTLEESIKKEYYPDDKFEKFLFYMSFPVNCYYISIFYYIEIDLIILNNYKISKYQLSQLCKICERNNFLIHDDVGFDYNQVFRRMKIDKILNKLSSEKQVMTNI